MPDEVVMIPFVKGPKDGDEACCSPAPEDGRTWWVPSTTRYASWALYEYVAAEKVWLFRRFGTPEDAGCVRIPEAVHVSGEKPMKLEDYRPTRWQVFKDMLKGVVIAAVGMSTWCAILSAVHRYWGGAGITVATVVATLAFCVVGAYLGGKKPK